MKSEIGRIPIEFLKQTIELIKFDLQLLCTYILEQEIYPDPWGNGLHVTLPKGNNDICPITINLYNIVDNHVTL